MNDEPKWTPLKIREANKARRAAEAAWWKDPPVHPAALLFPMMSDAEIDALAADIKKNGLQEPIVIWVDNREEPKGVEGPFPEFLLDGRNRAEALKRLGITNPRDALKTFSVRFHDGAIRHKAMTPGMVLGVNKMHWSPGLDPWDYVMSANAHRRHLTPEQKRDAIARFIKERPQASNRKIAKALKVSHPVVAKVRSESVPNGNDYQVEHLPIERAKEAVRANPGASVSTIAEMARVGRATAQRALKTAHLAPSPAKPSDAKTEPLITLPKPEPKESLEEPPPREPEVQKMSEEDIRKWVKSLWADYGRKRLTPGKLSQGAFKILVSHVLYKTSTPPVWKVIIGIMNAEV